MKANAASAERGKMSVLGYDRFSMLLTLIG